MKLVVITGQTATGKTDLAQELASKENGELINCDSRQIYKHLDIITGKGVLKNFVLDKKIGEFNIGYHNVPCSMFHVSCLWLYNIISPQQYFSSYDYAQCALYTIQKIMNRKKTPILVGGTYLYIKHLLYSVETERIPPDWDLRKTLENATVQELQEKLREIDADFFSALNESEKQNPQRLIRKIEIVRYRQSATVTKPVSSVVNRPSASLTNDVSELRNRHQPRLTWHRYCNLNLYLGGVKEVEFIGLKHKTKESLVSAITQRVEKRIQQGAFEEVTSLLKKGYTSQDPGMRTIGYQQIIKYLQGLCTKEQAIGEWTTKEIQYAKRQYTFMKKDENIVWREI